VKVEGLVCVRDWKFVEEEAPGIGAVRDGEDSVEEVIGGLWNVLKG